MKMKKVVATLAMLAVLCTAFSGLTLQASAATLATSYESSTYVGALTINAVNDHRNADYLVLYKHGYDAAVDSNGSDVIDGTTTNDWYESAYYTGAGHTSCNPWGTEVAVNQYGIVTKIVKSGEGNNMAIPTGGFVLSGNGTGATTLNNNVKIGDHIVLRDGSDADAEKDTFDVFRTTEDSQYTADSAACSFSLTGPNPDNASQTINYVTITMGGSGVTTGSTVWQNDILVKATGTGNDGVTNHKGYVVKYGGNDIEVPSGYFALTFSGQSLDKGNLYSYNGADLFKRFAAPGALVNIGTYEVFFRYDVAAAIRGAYLMTGLTNTSLTMPVDTVYDYSAATLLANAKNSYKLVDIDAMQSLYDNMASIVSTVKSITATTKSSIEKYHATINQNYNDLYELSFEKKPVEMRAAWTRPLQPTEASTYKSYTKAQFDAMVEADVLKFKNLGYNMLFLEAQYNSTTIFPVPSSTAYNGLTFKQNPYLTTAGNSSLTANYDMLQAYIDCCAENDMELNVWWEVFYVGYDRTNDMTDDLFTYSPAYTILNNQTKYQDYLATASNGEMFFNPGGVNQYFLNPASTGARTFLMKMMSYVWNTYDADGFQIDYIRYPKNTSEKGFGYDTTTMNAFKASSYYNSSTHTDSYLKTGNGIYDDQWIQFRADYITSFVKEIHDTLAADRPDMYLMASPESDLYVSRREIQQDVAAWMSNGYIDVLFPMSYGENVPEHTTEPLVEGQGDHYVCVGVSGDFYNESWEKRWLSEVREDGAMGVAYFATSELFSDDVWSESAITPLKNTAKAAKVYLEEVINARADKMYSLSGITSAKCTSVKNATAAAVKAIRLYGIDSSEALTAINAIQTVANGLGTNPKAALTADVNFLKKMRANSRDEDTEDYWLDNNSETLKINGTAIASDSSDFVYTNSTNTLLIKSEWATLTGTMPGNLNVVLADGVETVELKNLTMSSDSAFDAIEASGTVDIELTGTNTLTASTLSSSTITYFGTGNLSRNGSVVRRQGDANGSGTVNTDDIRLLMQYSVGEATLTTARKNVCDADLSGAINTIDIRMFLDAWYG